MALVPSPANLASAQVIREHDPMGVTPEGLTFQGFLYLHTLFLERGRAEAVWAVRITTRESLTSGASGLESAGDLVWAFRRCSKRSVMVVTSGCRVTATAAPLSQAAPPITYVTDTDEAAHARGARAKRWSISQRTIPCRIVSSLKRRWPSSANCFTATTKTRCEEAAQQIIPDLCPYF